LEESLEEKPDYGLGEGDPAIVHWELNRALLEQSRERASSLEQALSRLSQGTYGICEQCGEMIHPDRIAVLPDVRLCIRCARAGKTT
jgi:RNA polymerase-binding transcription factor DksA